MANYSLIINSRFRPFEYQELLAPVLMATQAHQALEEAYGNLDTEAAVWDRRTEGSEKAHSLYTNFSKDLAGAAETLSKYGLTPQSRKAMLNMKRRYASDITPIVEAWTKRQADIKAQQEAMLRDPYHAFNRVAADTSLDTYLDNPNIDVLSENASGAVLAAQVRAMAGDIKNYIDNKNIGKLEKLGLPYQYIQKIIHGATADQVLKTMQGDPEATPFLHNIVETVMKGSGVRDWSSMNGDWANNPIYKRLESQAMTGLTAAIGTTELRNYTDSFSMQDALNARQHARAVAEQRRKEIEQLGRLNPLPLRSQQEIGDNNKTIDKWVKAGYFKKDASGKYIMTHKGFEEMRNVITLNKQVKKGAGPLPFIGGIKGQPYWSGDTQISAYVGPMKQYIKHTPFYDFMVKLNGGKSFLDEKGNVLHGWGPRRAGNLFNAFVVRNEETSYDTYHSTEYDRQIPEDYGKEIKKQLWADAGTKDGHKVLIQVDFNGKDGWKDVKALRSSDLSGWNVSNVRYSKYGNTAIFYKEGEDPIRVRLPKGINLGAERNIKTAIDNADDWGLIISKGVRPKTNAQGTELLRDANGNIQFTNIPQTEADQVIFNKRQRDALNDMGYYGSQLVVPSKTKDEEYKTKDEEYKTKDEEYTPFNF